MKRFLKYIAFLALILVLGGFLLYFIAKKYEPEVKDAVVYELNRFLSVPVEVEDINLSLIQRFPYASLRFSKLSIPAVLEGKVQPDTLLYIEDLYLQIGLFDFLRKRYKVSEAEINDAYFNMKVDGKGRTNYIFWKTYEDEKEAPELSLENIEFNEVYYSFESSEKLWLSINFEKAKASGNFGERVFKMNLKSKAEITTGSNKQDLLYETLKLDGDAEISLNLIQNTYQLISQDIKLENQELSLDAAFNTKDKEEWAVHAFAESADLEKIQRLLPLNLRAKLSDYKIDGNSNLNLNLKAGTSVDIGLSFAKLDADLEHLKSNGKATLTDVSGMIDYVEKNSNLSIERGNVQLGPGSIDVMGEIKNFANPDFNLQVRGGMDLASFKEFFNITQVSKLEGKLSLDGNLRGNLSQKTKNEQLEFLKGISFDGDISIARGGLRLKGQGLNYDEIEGSFRVEKNTIELVQATARLNENPFEVKGTLYNALPYLYSRNENLKIQAQFKAKELDFNKIWAATEESTDTTYNFQLPSNVSFELDFEVPQISFRRFKANEVRGIVYFKSGTLTVNPLSFVTAGGQASSRIAVRDKGNNTFQGDVLAEIQNVNIEEFFYQFEDFDQNIVKSENLEGKATASISFKAPFKSSLAVEKNAIESEIDVTIEKGKLKNLPAFKDMIAYMRKKALWNTVIKMNAFEANLKEVQFQTLQNNILIRNGQVTIPAMEVNSSALNINVSGTHSFTNEINYRLNFRLNELLKMGKAQTSEFGEIQDDGTGLRLFLKMVGTAENPIFDVDNDAARTKRKNQFEEEKATMKSILKEEFGLFKKDSLPEISNKPDSKKPIISVEWDEFDSKKDSTVTKKNKKRKSGNVDDDLYDKLEEDDDL